MATCKLYGCKYTIGDNGHLCQPCYDNSIKKLTLFLPHSAAKALEQWFIDNMEDIIRRDNQMSMKYGINRELKDDSGSDNTDD